MDGASENRKSSPTVVDIPEPKNHNDHTGKNMRRPLSRDPTGTEVAFHNVNYSVKTKVKGKKGTKQILKEVK